MTRVRALLLAVLLAAPPAGCGAPDFSYFESITSGPNPHTTLILIWLSDSPVDLAEHVEVTVERVELVGAEGPVLLSDARRTIDLLALQNGARAKLAESEVAAGPYTGIRLTLAALGPFAPSIDVGGAVHPLQFARPGANVVELFYGLSAPKQGRVEIQLDFNVRLSVTQAGNAWLLDPHVDALEPGAAGEISGRVVDAFGLPVPNATVVASRGGLEARSTRTAADGSYRLALLLPGLYDVALWGPLGRTSTRTGVAVEIGAATPLDLTP